MSDKQTYAPQKAMSPAQADSAKGHVRFTPKADMCGAVAHECYGAKSGHAPLSPPMHFRSHGEVDSDRRSGRVRLQTLTLETTMQVIDDRPEAASAIHTNLGAIFVSLELSQSTWLITSLSPGGGEKMSKHVVHGGDIAGLLERFARLQEKARARTGRTFPIIVIHEAGLDGFWIDRVLKNEGIESHVVDPASVATSRRRRRAKTDKIDGEALVRTLLAYKRGEPRVCAMVKAPTPEEEDRRRLCRERKVLITERVTIALKDCCSRKACVGTSRCVVTVGDGSTS